MDLPSLDYDSAKALIQDPDPKARLRVAANADAPAETLYYLAEDPDLDVRLAVATNPTTPRLANLILAKDADYGVRCAIARKFVGEGLSGDQRANLWRLGFTILEALATDTVVRVRQVLANGLKSMSDAPRGIILSLARDPEPEVAAPILEHSPVLTDADLAELFDDGAPAWAQQAIVRRKTIGPALADKIALTAPDPLVARLISNDDAQISEATLDRLVDRAPDCLDWHEPLVRRRFMPGRLLVRLAEFVARPLLALLLQRRDLDRATEKQLDGIAADRGLHHTEDSAPAPAGIPEWAKGTAAERTARSWETGADMAVKLHTEGRLDDDVVAAALDSGENDFVMMALAIRAHLGQEAVRAIVDSRSAKAITALCWKACFKMRFAMDVQKRLGKIPPDRLLNARDGVDYPLTQDEMRAQLKYFVE